VIELNLIAAGTVLVAVLLVLVIRARAERRASSDGRLSLRTRQRLGWAVAGGAFALTALLVTGFTL